MHIAPQICTFTSNRGALLSTQHRVQTLREANGLTITDLAELSGVYHGTISKIENGTSPYKTNWTVAERLADALYVKVSDLFLAIELSHLGRHAATGSNGDVTLMRETIVIEQRVTITREIVTGRGEAYCRSCFLVVPSTSHCTQCGKEL